jgi:hypothetical protein
VNQEPQTIWVVVLVESGIPVSSEAFQKQDDAVHREQQLRAEMREEYDEVGVFETAITL